MRSPLASFRTGFSLALLFASPSAILSQPHAPLFHSIDPIAFDTSGPVIRAHSEPAKPFTVAGERGVLVGQQDGTFESWLLPVKVLSHLTIEANVEGYTVPIDVNQMAAAVEVRPDRTVITYSDIPFTVRQIMFSPADALPGTGPIVLFEFDCLHPTDFTLRFTPNLEYMWPERNEGVPGAEWVATQAGFAAGDSRAENDKSDLAPSGYYVLHADYPDLAAALTIPGARAGILAPYQERPQVHPVELKLHIDPARDHGRLFPLLMAVGTDRASADTAALGATLEKLNASISAHYATHAAAYKKLLASTTSIETPDKALNEAFQWAVISIEQLKTHVPAAPGSPTAAEAPGSSETALVAGYFASGDSARPGFGWFFGRDALYTLYAVNSYGDFALSKSELEFLIRRQREDGKIMHEYSQTAARIDWKQFPYMYAAADATPLFLLATLDYVRASGDTAFLTTHRAAIEKAYAFLIDPAHDTDHDGIYDNSQGTGWVESWPGGMPHQEIYLALLVEQASNAMAEIEDLLGDRLQSGLATKQALSIARTIEMEYYVSQKSCYAFSHNSDGSQDRTTTVYPALAWWSGNSTLAHGDQCLQQFASHTLNTDWGLRDVSSDEKIYDGMSYHQGSVWPLFTGWAALAEYRGNQPLAGYQILMENANLTRAQDLGADTELLSGDFFIPFGRSTSHQLWSSAMVITPTLRGLFGIDIDAKTKTITVNPHLPAGWDHAQIRNLQLPGGSGSITFDRKVDHIETSLLAGTSGNGWHLRSDDSEINSSASRGHRQAKSHSFAPSGETIQTQVPSIEIDQNMAGLNLIDSAQADLPDHSPHPGARTSRFRLIHSEYGDRKLTLIAEGQAGSEAFVGLVRHDHVVPKATLQPGSGIGGEAKISMRELTDNPEAPALLVFNFPPGEGWKTITVTLTW